jgi:LysR family glycine cleavage system transcriptional activator
MVALDVAEGRLVRLADAAWLEDVAYYLVYPQANAQRPKVVAFRRWILDAASGAREPRRGRRDSRK